MISLKIKNNSVKKSVWQYRFKKSICCQWTDFLPIHRQVIRRAQFGHHVYHGSNVLCTNALYDSPLIVSTTRKFPNIFIPWISCAFFFRRGVVYNAYFAFSNGGNQLVWAPATITLRPNKYLFRVRDKPSKQSYTRVRLVNELSNCKYNKYTWIDDKIIRLCIIHSSLHAELHFVLFVFVELNHYCCTSKSKRAKLNGHAFRAVLSEQN